MLTVDRERHEYRWNGQLVPSVTDFTDQLNNFGWATKEQLEAARERGTDVHTACTLDDMNDLVESSLTDEVRGYVEGWRKFRRECRPRWVMAEAAMYHPLYRYAGTPDRVGLLHDRDTVGDIKTGVPSPATGVQLAGYELMINSDPSVRPINHRVGIYLSRDGGYRLIVYDELIHMRAFLSLVTLRTWFEEVGR